MVSLPVSVRGVEHLCRTIGFLAQAHSRLKSTTNPAKSKRFPPSFHLKPGFAAKSEPTRTWEILLRLNKEPNTPWFPMPSALLVDFSHIDVALLTNRLKLTNVSFREGGDYGRRTSKMRNT
jgi:hypothetical protein